MHFKISKYILKHKALSLLVLLQIAMILLLLIKLPAERCVSEFEFSTNNSSTDNSYIQLDSTHILRSGAYEVIIDYQIQEGASATVSLVSEKKPFAVTNKTLSLDNQKGEISARVWISLGNGVDDLKVNLSSDKLCEVTHVRFTEILKYRILRLIGYFLLFVFIDALIFLVSNKRISNKTKFTILGIFAIALLSSFPDFTNYACFQHDYIFHMNRILSISDALRGGYFPVRIHFRLLHGYGFANSIFYGDIFLYFPAVLYNMGMSIQMAYKVYLIAVNFGTALITYWCMNKITNNYKIALFGSLVYTLAPYRITNVFIRGAVGEYTAMMFLPLICYGFIHIYDMPDDQKGKWKDSLPLAIGLTGCILTHILSVEMLALFIAAFCILNFKKTFAKNRFFLLLKTLIITVFINIWFIIPLLDYNLSSSFKISEYKPLMRFNLNLSEIFTVFFKSVDSSFFLGAPFVIASVIYLILYIRGKNELCLSKKISWFMGFGWFAVFMTSCYFPWELLRNISVTVYDFFAAIQFSWRYLSIATVMLTFLTVLISDYLNRKGDKKSNTVFMTLISVFCLVPILMFYPNYATYYDKNTYYSVDNISSDYIMDDFYLPAGTDTALLTLTGPTSTDEELAVESWTEKNHRFEIVCNNSSDESKILQLPLINYKGYVAYDIDSNEILEIVNSENNTLNVKVPKQYSGTVKVEFKEPSYWRFAEIISLLSIIIYLILCFADKNREAKISDVHLAVWRSF